MSKEDNNSSQVIEINLSSIKNFITNYKIPLFFGLIGTGLIIFGAFLLYQKPQNDNSIKIIKKEQGSGKKIFVDIQGAVLSPGVYELNPDARVKDALIAAGGLSDLADREWTAKNLNLAAKIPDAAKIYIPQKNESPPKSTTLGISISDAAINTQEGKININTATLSELDTLYGIGPKTAQKIIDNRPYSSIEELVTKKAVWQSTFDKIKDKITAF